MYQLIARVLLLLGLVASCTPAPAEILYKTPGAWGAGVGERKLTAAEVDNNFAEIASPLVGGQVKGVYYVSTSSSITDHGNAAVPGSFANTTNSLRSSPYGGEVVFPKGTFAFASDSLRLFRNLKVRGAGKDATIITIAGDKPGVVFDTLSSGTVGALNWSLSDLTIQGENDGAKTGQHGIEFSSTAQYGTVERVRIYRVGGRGLNFPGTGLGAIFNSCRDVEIIEPRGYGVYIAGESSQTVFDRVRIFGGYSHGFVFGGQDGTGYSPKSNTFIGCAYESTSTTDADVYGVWFDNASEYGAYDTTFFNCYMEPKGRTTGDTACYWIEAAKGVKILGGMCAFAHWGVVGNSAYTEGLDVERVTFYKTATWAGNLTSKAMIAGNNGARVHVGAGNASTVTGTTWAETSGLVYGFRNPSDTLRSVSAPSYLPPNGALASRPSATSTKRGESYYVSSASGLFDHWDVNVKTEADTYVFAPIGTLWDYNATISFPGTGVVAGGASVTTANIACTGAALGRFVRIAPSIDTAGWQITVHALAGGNIKITLTNTTAGNLELAAGTWRYAIATY